MSQVDDEGGIYVPLATSIAVSSIRLWPIRDCSRHGFTPNGAA